MITWTSWPSSAPQPPCPLPCTKNALGASVELQDVYYAGEGGLAFQLEVKDKTQRPKGTVLRPGLLRIEDVPALHSDFSMDPIQGYDYGEVFEHFEIPGRYTRATVAQQVYVDRGKKTTFRFTGLTLGSKSVSCRAGSMKLSLTNIYMNEKLSDFDFVGNCKPPTVPCFAVEVQGELPQHAYLDRQATLIDDAGRRYKSVMQLANIMAVYLASEIAMRHAAMHPPVLERFVGWVDEDRRSNMQIQRENTAMGKAFQEAARAVPVVYVFPAMTRVPSKFMFEVGCALPPDPKDTAWVRFENVSLPAPPP